MVSIKEVKPGNLLVSITKVLHLIVEIRLDEENPDNSIIVGVNENNVVYEGTPDKWYHLFDSRIDISQINLQNNHKSARKRLR